MNCKKGDLAVYVSSQCGNEGKIVRIIKFIGQPDEGCVSANDVWRIDHEVQWKWNRMACARDANLRPIRDSDGQDETLTWKTVPSKETA
jgi:hypothetical protein